MGRSREELAPSLRSLPVDKYVIFYRPIENGIQVERVLSGYRDLASRTWVCSWLKVICMITFDRGNSWNIPLLYRSLPVSGRYSHYPDYAIALLDKPLT